MSKWSHLPLLCCWGPFKKNHLVYSVFFWLFSELWSSHKHTDRQNTMHMSPSCICSSGLKNWKRKSKKSTSYWYVWQWLGISGTFSGDTAQMIFSLLILPSPPCKLNRFDARGTRGPRADSEWCNLLQVYCKHQHLERFKITASTHTCLRKGSMETMRQFIHGI